MATETVAEAIVSELESAGIERGYCVPGESYLAILDALYASDISLITCRQEGGASYMAMAEGRLTNKTGLVLVTRGPGASNAMIGIHCAYEEGVPMVALVGLPPLSSRGSRAFQEFELSQWFSTTSKQVVVVDEPQHARWSVSNALRWATSGRPGPVIIGVPEDILKKAVPSVSAPLEGVEGEISTVDVSGLARRIERSRRPVVVVGDDRMSERASTALTTWCAARSVPILADFRCYALVDNSSEVYAGALGVGKTWNISAWIAEADLIVYLGCVRSDINSDHVSDAYDKPTIVVGEPEVLPFHSGRLDQLINADRNQVCHALEAQGPAQAAPDSERTEWLRSARKAYVASQDVEAAVAPGGRLQHYPNTGRLAGAIRDDLPPGTIVTFGAGNFTAIPQTLIPAAGHKAVIGTRNGSMGLGVPAAVAAKLARPDVPVIAFAGDGDVMMNGQEMATATMFNAPVVVVVVDNSRYGTIRDHQEREFPGRISGTNLDNPGFQSLAQSFGWNYLTAEEVLESPDLFHSALHDDVSTLVYVREESA